MTAGSALQPAQQKRAVTKLRRIIWPGVAACLRVSACLSVCLSVCVSVCVSVCPCVCLSVPVPVCALGSARPPLFGRLPAALPGAAPAEIKQIWCLPALPLKPAGLRAHLSISSFFFYPRLWLQINFLISTERRWFLVASKRSQFLTSLH